MFDKDIRLIYIDDHVAIKDYLIKVLIISLEDGEKIFVDHKALYHVTKNIMRGKYEVPSLSFRIETKFPFDIGLCLIKREFLTYKSGTVLKYDHKTSEMIIDISPYVIDLNVLDPFHEYVYRYELGELFYIKSCAKSKNIHKFEILNGIMKGKDKYTRERVEINLDKLLEGTVYG